MTLRHLILLFLLIFGLTPLLLAVLINLPLVIERTTLFYQKAYLQNLRADFRDLDQHLASRHEMIRLLAKLPEPGLILGEQGEDDEIDLARARYTTWINQILADQQDVIQILFLSTSGDERFWLVRDVQTQQWRPTPRPPVLPSQAFIEAGLTLKPGGVLVSRIRIDPQAGIDDPRRLLTLDLISPIGAPGGGGDAPPGVVVLKIDVGGMAQFYRDTLWVNHDGQYLNPGQAPNVRATAFDDFPGLAGIFAEGKLAVWRGAQGQQWLWVPMFLTENATPLWVGRPVDPSPIEDFRDALILRVISIVLVLVGVVMILARWIAARAEHFGRTLTGGIGRILRDGEPMRFHWRGPREIRELGEQLTALAETHAEHLRAARAHNRELEQSYRYKSEFLANVSHELRTPLNSILLLSKLLADRQSGLELDQQRQAQVIYEAGRDLRAMIDNILDISLIEAGRLRVMVEWIELPSLIEELIELLAPLFAEKGLYLRFDANAVAGTWISSDREKLRQILKNFLSNAVKFTERGGVEIHLETHEEGPRPLAIHVSDTGIGIPGDKQEVIFEAFQQADGSTRRRYGGTGLGLSISRELARLLDGEISVSSTEGQGARFTLRLPRELAPGSAHGERVVERRPRQPAEDRGPAPDLPPPFADGWVLVVERDVEGLLAVTTLLESHGLRVQTAADLDEAVETLREEEGCILILLAALVSAADTCDTIASIRQECSAWQIPILVMGDCGDRPWQSICSVTGADGAIGKPIEQGALESALARLLERRATQGP